MKANSGTLLVHKCTHYFDLINWWLEDEPKEVYAKGGLKYYGPNREMRGVKVRRLPARGQVRVLLGHRRRRPLHGTVRQA